MCVRDGKQTLVLLAEGKQHWTYTNVFQNPSADTSGAGAGQTELHREVAGLGTTLADGHSVLLVAAGAAGSGKTLTLVGDSEEAKTLGGFFLLEQSGENGAGSGVPPTASGGHSDKKSPKKGKGKGVSSQGDASGGSGGGVTAKVTPLTGIFPRLIAETFATLAHRSAQCAFVVWVSAAAVSTPATTGTNDGTVECLLPPPPSNDSAQVDQVEDRDCANDQLGKERDPHVPPPAPPEDRLWGRALPASSPDEAMVILEDARSRSRAVEMRHFLARVRLELKNRSTNEVSSCEMVIAELAEEKPGDSWPTALAEVVRAHSAATAIAKSNETDGLLGMIRGCLTDTAKVCREGGTRIRQYSTE